ncbi:hypothetical protein K493DRAFT_300340 [Basidiobolus meristosporus CBS 931.73]|uniref:Chitin-binding type-4 domain-containing protein n=1 Tax=Basidiobolus meristosporus CBS 931.73 TaxID=1314790 RepID=A0A1Y1YI08_9FUNG|nr:hypothetical protein K493DRAFT_300340 [Basidiobolus meristosporus CBS 931.73]|eukprot:ORX97671.1 hypothetical protein K493DRAFT_300340 [Basidiobolus meristosporus CBS 931.73]
MQLKSFLFCTPLLGALDVVYGGGYGGGNGCGHGDGNHDGYDRGQDKPQIPKGCQAIGEYGGYQCSSVPEVNPANAFVHGYGDPNQVSYLQQRQPYGLPNSPWAQWILNCVDANHITLQAEAGNYIARCNICITGAFYLDSAFVHKVD